jgi:hypothetical protein
VLIIFASRFDRDAQSLADRWSAYDATLLTAEDLSVAGWRHYLDSAGSSTAMIGGRAVETEKITAVLTRWPAIHEREITHVGPDDRSYVAAEMTAFLRSWLTQLKCPVVNRPTATTLFGPAWRPEQWVHVAASLGLRVRPVERRTGSDPDPERASAHRPSRVVTVVGERYFGAVDPFLGQQARRLARAAGVDILAVHYDGPEQGAALLSADLMADLSTAEIADAVLANLLRDSSVQPSHQERA